MADATGTQSVAIDPISHIADAVGTMFQSTFGFLSMGKQVKISQEQTKQYEQMTEQERIQYMRDQENNLSGLTSQMWASNNKTNTSKVIILVGLFLIIALVIWKKK